MAKYAGCLAGTQFSFTGAALDWLKAEWKNPENFMNRQMHIDGLLNTSPLNILDEELLYV